MQSLSFLIIAALGWVGISDATNPRPYPPVDSYLKTTSFLNHSSYLTNLDDQQWYLDNIPFIDVPEQEIQDVYYYRTSVIKRHLKWTHEGTGWVATEFINPVSWALKYQTIADSAGHHVLEMRWLRDPNYVYNLIEAYTRGGAQAQGGIRYTNYMWTAILEHAQTTGNVDFLTAQLDGMIEMYGLWNITRDNTTGLYFRTPLLDAQEYSLPGYLTGGPLGGPVSQWNDFGLDVSMGGGNDYDLIWNGPLTYRPSFNAYMVAGARAIGQVAEMAGQQDLANTWTSYGDDLNSKMEDQLYSHELNFWIDVVRGTNLRCQGRELIGYYPYRFGVGTNETYLKGLEAGLTSEGFLTEFGPATLEVTSPYYTPLKNTTYCCLWQGQSWPFSTCVYLDTLADIARTGNSNVVTQDFFYSELLKYTRTNYKDGVPFVAESHYPEINQWSGDTTNHSENYFHSTYIDNVFSNLFGIVPEFDNRLVLEPLIPSNWSYFAVENLPYHGTLLTMIWDKDGSHYKNSSAGFSLYSNGTMFHHQASLGSVNVSLPFNVTEASQALSNQPQYQNILANLNTPWGLPNITSDWDFVPDGDYGPWPAWKLNDGLLWYDTTPDNRWTNNQSEVPYSTFNITLPRARQIHSISLAVFTDEEEGGVVACPNGIKVTDSKGQVVAFKHPWDDCVPNALNTVPFAPPSAHGADNQTTPNANFAVETDFLQVTVSDRLRYTTALSEIQIWVEPNMGPRYEAEDGLIGTFIGSFEGLQTGLNGTVENKYGTRGVSLGKEGWVELSGVRTPDGAAGKSKLIVSGAGPATVVLQTNWLVNQTLTFEGSGLVNKTVDVNMLKGGNVFTIFQQQGEPFLDAIISSS